MAFLDQRKFVLCCFFKGQRSKYLFNYFSHFNGEDLYRKNCSKYGVELNGTH